MEMRMQGEKGESGRQCAVRNTASFIPAMIQAHDLIVATSNSESEKRGKKGWVNRGAVLELARF